MCCAFSLVSFAMNFTSVPFIPLSITCMSFSGLLTVNQQQCVISAAEASPCVNDQRQSHASVPTFKESYQESIVAL